jgi:hypothetical protein
MALLAACAEAKAGKLTINCWEFNRGNAKVMDNPAKYGDYRDKHPDLMLIAGDEQAWFVEYDLDFPSNATYAVRTRFASAGEYPLDILIDGKRVGQICLRETAITRPISISSLRSLKKARPFANGTCTALSGRTPARSMSPRASTH